MQTVEQIASFIQNSIKKEVKGKGVNTVVNLDDGYWIEQYEAESVLFCKEDMEGVEVDVPQLRALSSYFDEVCQCPDCDDKGWYEVLSGSESRRYECECDNLPFGISINAKK